MKLLKKLLVLMLVLAVLLGGCDWKMPVVKFQDMEYVRPDLQEYRDLLEEVTTLAEAGEDFERMEDALWDYSACYSSYYTNYALADIHYCIDTSDIYWTEEYDFFMETYAEVDAGLDQLYHTLAESDFRE